MRNFRTQSSSSIGITPGVLSRRIWSWHRLVRRIGPTVSANPANGGQTLLRYCEPTIRGTGAHVVISTPRIVLCRSGFFKADQSREHSKNEQGNPHGNFLVIPVTRSGPRLISRIESAESVDSACGSRALFKCCEAAVCNPANHPIAINCAPWTVLGLGRRANSDDAETNDPEDELREPHRVSETTGSQTTDANERYFIPHSRSGTTFAANKPLLTAPRSYVSDFRAVT